MKNLKRSIRRFKSKSKLEKRINLWVRSGHHFIFEDIELKDIGGHEIEIVKNLIRKKGYFSFLKWTSKPCSCYICKKERYKRPSKSKVNKIINEQLDG